jgi:hypothetical protein
MKDSCWLPGLIIMKDGSWLTGFGVKIGGLFRFGEAVTKKRKVNVYSLKNDRCYRLALDNQ